ncbi:MAG: adenosylhomocysteinase [Bdellovibrionota bacterium]
MSKVKNPSLATRQILNLNGLESRMPVLMELRRKYEKTKPFKGAKIAGCIHVTKETAVRRRTLAQQVQKFPGPVATLFHPNVVAARSQRH